MSKETDTTTPQHGFVRESIRSRKLEPWPEIETMGADREEWKHIYEDVAELKERGYLQGVIHRLGLPEGSDWNDVDRFTDEQDRRHLASRYGLPDTATFDELLPHLEAEINGDISVPNETPLISQVNILHENQNLYSDETLESVTAAFFAYAPLKLSWEDIFRHVMLIGINTPEHLICRLKEVEGFCLDKVADGERQNFPYSNPDSSP